MGVFGIGLYAGDFALDVRATVGAVLRLPFKENTLVDIICSTEPSAANSTTNEDHTTFWLVVADQFAKRGVACDRVRNKVLDIIDNGSDIAMLERLGMKAADLHKRQRMLDELRVRIVAAPTTSKPRRVLQTPQPLLMEVGDVMLYPTCLGENINPYFASKELDRVTKKDEPPPWRSVQWKQDGWGAMVIVDCGRAFDYLAWYRPVTLAEARQEKPTLNSLRGAMLWRVELHGTCSPRHFKKMELEKIGVLPVDRQKAKDVYPTRHGTGLSAAVKDLSLADRMHAALPGTAISNPQGAQKGRIPTISGIEEVLQG